MDCSSVHGSLDFDFDYEPSRIHIIAKKRWKCRECGVQMGVGQEHVFHSSVQNGSWFASRVCLDCQSMIDNLFEDWYSGSTWDDLAQHVWDCQGNISYEKVSKLTPVARARVCDMVEKSWPGGED